MDKLKVTIEYAMSFVILSLLVYFLPGVFIGLVSGLALGMNYDKVKSWLDSDNSDNCDN